MATAVARVGYRQERDAGRRETRTAGARWVILELRHFSIATISTLTLRSCRSTWANRQLFSGTLSRRHNAKKWWVQHHGDDPAARMEPAIRIRKRLSSPEW
jgi:hypothetical protein